MSDNQDKQNVGLSTEVKKEDAMENESAPSGSQLPAKEKKRRPRLE